MHKHHPRNERNNRTIVVFGASGRMSASSVDQMPLQLASRSEQQHKDLREFRRTQAIAFRERLKQHVNAETSRRSLKPPSLAVERRQGFIIWLAGRPGYRSRITYADAEYFNLSANNEWVSHAARLRPVPTLEEISAALNSMPTDTAPERRDRAVIAFALLSGARDNAIASLSLNMWTLLAASSSRMRVTCGQRM